MDAHQAAVATVVDLLVDGDYESLETMSRGRRMSASDLQGAVADYGRTLVPLPPEALESLDVVAIDGAVRPTVSVVVDLWTEEDGRSDLSIELRLANTDAGAVEVEVVDLRVL